MFKHYNPDKESNLIKQIGDTIEFGKMRVNPAIFIPEESDDIARRVEDVVARQLISVNGVERSAKLLNSEYRDMFINDVKNYLKRYQIRYH